LTDIHDQGFNPREDVHHDGDDGTEEGPPSSVVHQGVQGRGCRAGSPAGELGGERRAYLDLTETAVRAWVNQADVDDGRVEGLTTSEREELAALRRENRRLSQDVEIPKRATAFFASRRPGERVPVHRGGEG
jgi:hypothetical protein